MLPQEVCDVSLFGLSYVQYTFTVMMRVLWSDIEPDSAEMVNIRETMGMITQGILSLPINLPGFTYYKALKVIQFTPFFSNCAPIIQHVFWSGVDCFTYKIFHAWWVFCACWEAVREV